MGFVFEGHRPAWVDEELYPFQDHWVELPDDGAIHYLDECPPEGTPSAGTVVFVHGTPTWSFEWRQLIAGLRATHRCLALDHLGFGLSERPATGTYTPEAHAARFRAWLDALSLTDFTLVVHDFGGPIALPAALDEPARLRALIVLNSFMWATRGDQHLEKGGRIMGGRFGLFVYRHLNASLKIITPMAYAERKKLTPRIHAQYLAPFTGIDSRERVLWALAHALLASSDFYGSQWERRAALSTLPALIVWGTKDPAFQLQHLARWREALPSAEVVELPVGHWPQEEAPEEVLAAVRAFLARVEPAAG
ncbi:MAG: alpha/beta fold hydrolase [Gemmatimonadetes bacterium]|nr:alpha/beta fold hydrolase [Gemmatimonadota bacterium]